VEIAKRGKAAVTICSSAFTAMGRAQAAKLGFARLPIATIAHPFGLRTRAEVRQMAERAVDEIAKLAEGVK
jgi:nitrogenase molybdenum-iron protein alpha/beta subunit